MSGLLVGIFFTVAVMIFGLVLYTKLFTSGMIGVEEYKLHSTFDKALGLRPGTRVQISGVDVGQITDMKIEGDGVYMEFTIYKKYQNWITDSAQVYAIRDQNVISARVINIEARRGKGRVLEDGEFLPPGKAQDIETVLETANGSCKPAYRCCRHAGVHGHGHGNHDRRPIRLPSPLRQPEQAARSTG